MRLVLSALLVYSFVPLLARADVTIRYKGETSGTIIPALNRTNSLVIHMKGRKGVMITDFETIIVDADRQEVTVADPVRKKFATVPASEYGARLASTVPAKGAAMLKGMKVTCDPKDPASAETIQGVHADEHDITCSMTFQMPDNMKTTIPPMEAKMVMRFWFASAAEKVRVPALWQLSDYELWQNVVNPMELVRKVSPDGLLAVTEALGKNRSATLRFNAEISANMPSRGGAGQPMVIVKMSQELVDLSTAAVDDSTFAVPAGYSAEPFADVMKGIQQAFLQPAK